MQFAYSSRVEQLNELFGPPFLIHLRVAKPEHRQYATQ